ncbi:MAG: hypothetical protein IKU70_10960 [Clostridia bacterium]|nr:hypothetical protein [Clostridia bacterium]
MTHAKKRGLCWLIAAAMTAAMMIFVLTGTDMLYATNDDAGIMHAVIGYETGEPASFHPFIHGLLLWTLGGLTRLFPAVAWFSCWQIGMLGLGSLVIAKSIMQSFVKYRKPLWLGAVMAAAFLAALWLKYAVSITFTTTSAILGAAAVLQMLSIEHDRGMKPVVSGMAGALALVVLSYVLRLSALMPVLGFCGLAWLFGCWEEYGWGKKRALKPMLISLAMVIVAVGAVLGIRQFELTRPGVQDYIAWQNARTEVMDYIDPANVPQEAYELVGWDDTTAAMAKNWCFLDSDITTEDFVQIAEYVHAQDDRTLADAWQTGKKVLAETWKASALELRGLAVAAIAAAAVFLFACFCPGKRLRLLLMLGVTVVCSAAMLLILAMAGRLPMRAALMILLPAAAIVFALLPASLPEKVRWPLALAVLVCAVQAGVCVHALLPHILVDEQQDLLLGSAMGDLEEYALFEPESLFIYDDTLVGSDLRVFPDYSEGVPDNVTFWGGWGLRSPSSMAQFARYDIDLNDVDPYDLLADNVYFVSGRIDPPPMVVLDWLRAKIGPNIDYELYSEYGYVYIFHFYEY